VAISAMDSLTGSPCFLCGEPIGNAWALREVNYDQWEVVCVSCELVTEVDADE